MSTVEDLLPAEAELCASKYESIIEDLPPLSRLELMILEPDKSCASDIIVGAAAAVFSSSDAGIIWEVHLSKLKRV